MEKAEPYSVISSTPYTEVCWPSLLVLYQLSSSASFNWCFKLPFVLSQSEGLASVVEYFHSSPSSLCVHPLAIDWLYS